MEAKFCVKPGVFYETAIIFYTNCFGFSDLRGCHLPTSGFLLSFCSFSSQWYDSRYHCSGHWFRRENQG